MMYASAMGVLNGGGMHDVSVDNASCSNGGNPSMNGENFYESNKSNSNDGGGY